MWLNGDSASEKLSQNPYNSVDPAPPIPITTSLSVTQLTQKMMDPNVSLFLRYRAIFSLRNMCTEESVLALTEGRPFHYRVYI